MKRKTLPGSLSDRCRLCTWHHPALWYNEWNQSTTKGSWKCCSISWTEWWMQAKQNSCAMSKTARSQSLKSLEGKNLECVTDFEYLGSWISTTSRDIASGKAKTWPVLHKLDNIWKSNLPRWLKMQFFRTLAESILLYGAEAWTLAWRPMSDMARWHAYA